MRTSIAISLSTALCSTAATAGDSFTVIGLPDTQFYSESYPEIFLAQTQWIAANAPALDVHFVSHYGDVVQHGDAIPEWDNAVAALDVLDASGLPWGVVPGNHDITASGSSGQPYIPQYFFDRYGPAHWQGRPYFLAASPSGMSNAQIFTGAGRQWLWLHIECDMPVREMRWAQGILDRHRDKAAVVTTHRWLQDAEDYTAGVPVVPSGRYPDLWYAVEGIYADDGVMIEDAWRWFMRKNPSVFLINCGHFHEEFRQTSTNVAGLPVHEVLADYQDDPNGGNGWLRIMTFNVAGSSINFESYSPTLGASRTADESLFTLPVQFDAYRLAEGTRFAAFQQDINDYTGTADTWISEADPNTGHGNDPTRWSDDDVMNSLFGDELGQALIKFENIVTADGANNTIPQGSTVVSASLTLEIAEDIDTPLFDPDFFVYQITVPWSESSTWNSLGGGLSGGELGMFVGAFSGDNNPNDDTMRRLDITALTQAWVNGTPNHGIAVLPEIISGNDDGIEIWSSESSNTMLHPRLEVTYISSLPDCEGDVDGSGTVDFADLLVALTSWGPCAACDGDVNGDDVVDFSDLLVMLTNWGPC